MKKWKYFAIAAVILAAVLIGGLTAYLNDSDTRTDPVTLSANLDIELLQPSWKGETLGTVRPRQRFDNDPRVLNHSAFDVYAFIEITQPYAQDLVAQDAMGKPLNADQPGGALYTYKVQDGWTLLADPILSDDGTGCLRASYVYAWTKDGELTPLHSGETTGPLFTQVEVVNYTKATLGERQDMTVGAYALDAAVLQDADPTAPKTPQTMWALLRNTYPTPTPMPSPTPESSGGPTPTSSPTPAPEPSPSTNPTDGGDWVLPYAGDGPAAEPTTDENPDAGEAGGNPGAGSVGNAALPNAPQPSPTPEAAKTYPALEWYPVVEESLAPTAPAA